VAPDAWLISDIPGKDVIFTRNHEAIKKQVKDTTRPVLTRDSVKILTRHGELKLLIDVPSSLMSVLSGYRNFIPRIYISPKTFEILEKKKILEKLRNQKF